MFIFGPLYCQQERFFVLVGSQATQWMAAGPPGVPGRSAAETAAGESAAGRGPAVTRSPSMEVRPAWGQHRSIRSATSPLAQVGRALIQTSYKPHKDTCTLAVHTNSTGAIKRRRPAIIAWARSEVNYFDSSLVHSCTDKYTLLQNKLKLYFSLSNG